MSNKKQSLDDLFTEHEAEQAANIKQDTPEEIARREAKKQAEIAREIRQGLRDANGDWIEQPEADEEENDEEEQDQ